MACLRCLSWPGQCRWHFHVRSHPFCSSSASWELDLGWISFRLVEMGAERPFRWAGPGCLVWDASCCSLTRGSQSLGPLLWLFCQPYQDFTRQEEWVWPREEAPGPWGLWAGTCTPLHPHAPPHKGQPLLCLTEKPGGLPQHLWVPG